MYTHKDRAASNLAPGGQREDAGEVRGRDDEVCARHGLRGVPAGARPGLQAARGRVHGQGDRGRGGRAEAAVRHLGRHGQHRQQDGLHRGAGPHTPARGQHTPSYAH